MLKLIAPFRVLFNLDSSLVAAQPGEFIEFVKAMRDAMADPGSALRSKIHPSLNITLNLPPEKVGTGIESRYSSLDTAGSFYVSPRVFTLSFQPSEHPQIESYFADAIRTADAAGQPYSQLFKPDINSLQIAFFDNSVAILSIDLKLDHSQLTSDEHAWDKLDQWTTHVVHYLLSDLYPKYIYPLIRGLAEFSRERGCGFVLDVANYRVFLDLVGNPRHPFPDLQHRFMLMWVNRTLIYRDDIPMNHWVRPCVREHRIIRLHEARLHLNWGNNLVMIPRDVEHVDLTSLWEGMLSAQYYYAAMDAVSSNLLKYIGVTFTKLSSKELRHLSNDMEIIVSSVTILQVRYKDISMEVQGLARDISHHLEKEWSFDTVVGNVKMKIDLCKANLTTLSQETGNRNAARTELVLTALAGVSVLNLMVDLSAYATQLPPDKMPMVGQIPGFMDLGFLLSGNVLAWMGILIGAAVVLFTMKNRQS